MPPSRLRSKAIPLQSAILLKPRMTSASASRRPRWPHPWPARPRARLACPRTRRIVRGPRQARCGREVALGVRLALETSSAPMRTCGVRESRRSAMRFNAASLSAEVTTAQRIAWDLPHRGDRTGDLAHLTEAAPPPTRDPLEPLGRSRSWAGRKLPSVAVLGVPCAKCDHRLRIKPERRRQTRSTSDRRRHWSRPACRPCRRRRRLPTTSSDHRGHRHRQRTQERAGPSTHGPRLPPELRAHVTRP